MNDETWGPQLPFVCEHCLEETETVEVIHECDAGGCKVCPRCAELDRDEAAAQ